MIIDMVWLKSIILLFSTFSIDSLLLSPVFVCVFGLIKIFYVYILTHWGFFSFYYLVIIVVTLGFI